jgi:solute carrier family 35 protein E3
VAIVLLNKIIFDHAGAAVSGLVTASHLLFQFAVLGAREAAAPTHAFRRFLHKESVLSSIAFAVCIPIQNLSLHLNSIPTNQMAKVLLLPCSILLNFIFFHQPPPPRLVPSLLLTVVGSLLFQLTDTTATAAGLAISFTMVCASWYSQAAMEQCRNKLGMTAMQQVLNVLPLGTAFVLATAPFVDSVSLSLAAASQHYVPLLRLPWMWFGLVLASCCLSLFVNVSCFHIVLSMSALSYKMLSHAKTVILFAIGIMFRGQPVSQRQWIGAATTFVGVTWYLMLLEQDSGRQLRAPTPLRDPPRTRAGRVKIKQ